MRNRTLGELKATLRSELRQSSNPAVAQSADHILVNAIKQAQSWCHEIHDWPHMRVREDVTLAAGSFQYDWPSTLDYDHVEAVSTKYGDRWLPVKLFQDDAETYNYFDTESDVRVDPVEMFRILNDSQLEVWPIPASDGGILRIKGLKRPPELSGDSIECPFDDQLIVKVAASRIAKKDEREGFTSSAMALLERLKARATTARPFHIGGAAATQPVNQQRELVVRIVRP